MKKVLTHNPPVLSNFDKLWMRSTFELSNLQTKCYTVFSSAMAKHFIIYWINIHAMITLHHWHGVFTHFFQSKCPVRGVKSHYRLHGQGKKIFAIRQTCLSGSDTERYQLASLWLDFHLAGTQIANTNTYCTPLTCLSCNRATSLLEYLTL